jgi:hypothetical protein
MGYSGTDAQVTAFASGSDSSCFASAQACNDYGATKDDLWLIDALGQGVLWDNLFDHPLNDAARVSALEAATRKLL